MSKQSAQTTKRHFLVVAATSRCARLFVSKALQLGHSVTALCRADSDNSALHRMRSILTALPGACGEELDLSQLTASNKSILDRETFRVILDQSPSIDAIACFVGPSTVSSMINPRCRIYTETTRAILEGMQLSRSVEVLYHSSVGAGGAPNRAYNYWPANFPAFSPVVHLLLPVFRNLARSEKLFESEQFGHRQYIVFRPATLRDGAARDNFLSLRDLSRETPYEDELKGAATVINREDVANEMLRVALLDESARKVLYRSSFYLTDRATHT